MQAVASLRYGVIFKKAFSQPEVFKGFVKDILGIDLQIDHVETEKSFTNPIGSIDSRFDLFAEDKVNRIIVDIQHRRYGDHYHRFLHYHCAALLEQSVHAKNYRPALEVYTIVVLTSGDKHKRDMSMIDFDPKDRHGKALGEIPHKVIYLCPKYVNEETPEPWRECLLAIDDSLDEEVNEEQYHKSYVQKILSSIRKDDLTPQERARMKDEYSEEEWLREKYQKNIEQKFEEGIEQGIEKGIEKGMQQSIEKIALTMLSQNMSVEQIGQLTGLAREQIETLKTSIK